MTTIASPYHKERTRAWRFARYQQAFSACDSLIHEVVSAVPFELLHPELRAKLSAALLRAKHKNEEAVAVLAKEAKP